MFTPSSDRATNATKCYGAALGCGAPGAVGQRPHHRALQEGDDHQDHQCEQQNADQR